MYRTAISIQGNLKNRQLLGECEQKIIDKSIDHWREKLKAVVRLNGGHIEQFF